MDQNCKSAKLRMTPAMVEAGEQEWLAWSERDDFSTETLVKSIYLAMREAQGREDCPAS
jgi:hypothetical protein